MRVSLYTRVSTEEQARQGLSLEAQLAALRKWASENGHTIVGEYVESGVSGRKPPAKRPALQRLLADLPALRVELIAFTKLDRWTRNVKGYYDVQSVLDRHGVAWAAIQEDYETVTASGRFKVNIMLSVAENEADRTSERIKTVFERKRERGEFTGRNVTPGYRIANKRVEIDPEAADMVRGLFQQYADEGSVHAVMRTIQRAGYPYTYQGVHALLRNRLYIGEFRGVPEFCPALIDKALFDRVQAGLARNTRAAPSGNVYLFSGLIRCSVCGARMAAHCTAPDGKLYVYYRCPNARTRKEAGTCDHIHGVNEAKLEAYLIANAAAELERVEAQQKPKRKRKQADPSTVKAKLSRLKDLYIDGLISREEYLADRERLAALLDAPQTAPVSLSATRTLFAGDFTSMYERLSQPQKKALWRSVISEIDADAENNFIIHFCGS